VPNAKVCCSTLNFVHSDVYKIAIVQYNNIDQQYFNTQISVVSKVSFTFCKSCLKHFNNHLNGHNFFQVECTHEQCVMIIHTKPMIVLRFVWKFERLLYNHQSIFHIIVCNHKTRLIIED
jgi:hypothetical protein